MEQETINLAEIIQNSINEIISKLFSSIDNTIYSLLDELTFISPDIMSNQAFRKIIGENNYSGILLICNSLILGIIIYYAINYLISHLTYSKIDSPKQFFFKAIIFFAIMNSSIWICEQIINIIFLITDSISDISFNLFNNKATFSNFIDSINKMVYESSDEFNIFSFDGIIKSFVNFGFINLLFTYSLRYIMIQVFIVISPFAFMSLTLNSTEWFFKVWIKTFISLLLTQILISTLLLIAFCILSSKMPANLSKILYVGIIFALSKSNNYMKELFGGISTNVNANMINSIK